MPRAAAPSAVRSRFVVLVAMATLAVAPARATPNFILDNGVIQIGVDIWGTLGASGGTLSGPPTKLREPRESAGEAAFGKDSTTLVGLRDMSTNFESVTYGTPHEGWGIADLLTVQGGGAITSAFELLTGEATQPGSETSGSFGPTPNLSHTFHELSGSGTVKESDGARFLTINDLVDTGGDAGPGEPLLAGFPLLRVTQDFRPSANPRAYEVEVTLENLSAGPVQPRFRRTVDWDIDPDPFLEYVTMRHGPSTAVVASVGNGFNDPNPLVALDPSGKGTTCPENLDFTDCGPDDLGAAIDLEFPVMLPGQQFRFWLYYGAAPTEAGALAILDELQASGGTLGQSATDGTPMTFFLGFKMPWAIIDNGVVQLGVGPYGELNVPGGTESAGGGGSLPFTSVGGPLPLPGTTTVGLRHVGLNWEGLGVGTPLEGWGLADFFLEEHGGVRSSLFPDSGPPPKLESLGDGGNGAFRITPISFDVSGTGTLAESSGDRARAVSEIGAPPFARVTHDFRPSEVDPSLYVVRVKIEPVAAPPLLSPLAGLPSLVYRRLLDWDAENTPLAELVTIDYPELSNVIASEGDAFQSPLPGNGLGSGFCPSDTPFSDCGPGDLGAAIDFNFPLLIEGQVEQFRLFYGAAAGTEAGALAALAAAGAEVYSLGQTSEGIEILGGGALGDGPAMTYMFGFRDVLFEDDFESADTSAWTSTVPAPL